VAVSQKAIDSQQDIVKQFLEVGVLKTNIDVSSFWSHEYDKELPISDK
jgi:sulfonate transport system substrate-binding protein